MTELQESSASSIRHQSSGATSYRGELERWSEKEREVLGSRLIGGQVLRRWKESRAQ